MKNLASSETKECSCVRETRHRMKHSRVLWTVRGSDRNGLLLTLQIPSLYVFFAEFESRIENRIENGAEHRIEKGAEHRIENGSKTLAAVWCSALENNVNIRNHPNQSKPIRTHLIPSEPIRTYPKPDAAVWNTRTVTVSVFRCSV